MKFLLKFTAIVSLIFSLDAIQMKTLRKTRVSKYSAEDLRSNCLNGGTSFTRRYDTFCICPNGFSGKNCEIQKSATCYNGNGKNYRGTVSRSRSGRECLEWEYESVELLYQSDALTLGLGKHNYCRNPDGKSKPWCHIKKGQQIVWEYCQIPHCAREPTSTCGMRERKLFKIVGGKVATIESHPWTAAIFQHSRSGSMFKCGGSLISPCWVLTAAHCFPDGYNTNPRRYSVYLGKNALNETDSKKEMKFEVENVILHPAFDDSQGSYNNDIALLKIRSAKGQCARESSSIKTICLPPLNQMLPDGSYCEIAGYGKEGENLWYYSNYLRDAKVQLMSQSLCRNPEYYGNLVTENMFCANSPQWNIDSCKGDSGGPLVCEVDNRMFLFGIVSWGEGCARKYRPGVYTRVTNYNKWIAEMTGLDAITSGVLYPQK